MGFRLFMFPWVMPLPSLLPAVELSMNRPTSRTGLDDIGIYGVSMMKIQGKWRKWKIQRS